MFTCPEKHRDDTSGLSPCSKFVKDWYERKTIRRSNRKKGRIMLKPISFETSTPSTTEGKQGDDEKSDHSQTDFKILDPPPLHSALHKKKSSENGNHKGRRTIEPSSYGDRPPPVSNVTCNKTPSLCYTPASEDDSFIDDYW
jgi:hypothetical protein